MATCSSSRAAWLAVVALLSVACRKTVDALPPDAGKFERSRLWNYPDERWDDPESQKQARLQFVWATPDEKSVSIFSMKLDGTDIRRVVGPELLYVGEARSLEEAPLRSPDRRYVACAGENTQARQLRYLIDLKTRSVRTIPTTTNPGPMRWSPDSRRILFVDDDKLWQYQVDSGAVTAMPASAWPGRHAVDGGRRFLSVRERSVILYDQSGKLIKAIDMPYRMESGLAVSDDGRYIAIEQVPFLVVDLESPKKPVFSNPGHFTSPVFGPGGGTLFFFGYYEGGLGVLDLASGELKELARLPGPWAPGSTTALAPVRRS